MIPAKSDTRRILENRLAQGNPGDTINPQEMAAIIDVDSDGSASEGYSIFVRATRAIEKQTGGEIVWRWDRDARTYRCLMNHEKPNEIAKRMKHVRREGKRSLRIAASTDIAKLDENARNTLIVNQVYAAVVDRAGSRAIKNHIASRISEIQAPDNEAIKAAMKARSTALLSMR